MATMTAASAEAQTTRSKVFHPKDIPTPINLKKMGILKDFPPYVKERAYVISSIYQHLDLISG
ncbi:MAG: hypothetical protein J5492_02930 [Oxalobacter sp.]|nr:hypothetical protein [Oxalobacter sp.]